MQYSLSASLVCNTLLRTFSLLVISGHWISALCLRVRVYSSTPEMSQHGDFNALIRFNGELVTVSSWPDDGERDHNSVTLKMRQWRGNVAVLSQTLCGGPFGSGSGFPGRPDHRMHGVLFMVGVVPRANRLSMYAWMISNGRNQSKERLIAKTRGCGM